MCSKTGVYMRKQCFVFSLLLATAILARGQALVGQHVLAGSGIDTPIAVATDSRGFVYVAGNTTSADFPVDNALEPQPPQGALEVSAAGAAFVNSGLNASTTDLSNRGISAVAASSDGTLVIASGIDASYRSIDGGVTWKPVADTSAALASALAVDPVNPSNVWALNQYGPLYQSSNGGVNWQLAAATPPNNVLFVLPSRYQPLPSPIGSASIVIDPRNPATLYVWSDSSVYVSTDGAQSWQQLSPALANGFVGAFAMAPSQPNVLYAVNLGVLNKSTDGGTTWTAGASVNVSGYATALAVDPTNASTLWVAATDGTVKRSTDGGNTFQTVATLSNSPATSVAIDPANPSRVYAATNSGVFETSDGGASWSPVFSGYAFALYAAPSQAYEFSGYVPTTVFLTKLDPALSQVIYSTYVWTGNVTGLAVDGQGNVALTGTSASGAIVMKLSENDGSVLYSTILNGTTIQPNAIAMDAVGNAVVAGTAWGLAVTKGAYESAPPGPCQYGVQISMPPAFVAKLNANGALVYATYLAGSCGDSAYGLAVDPAGDAYVAGQTYSHDFPVTSNAMIFKFPGAATSGFVAKLNPAGNQLLYSSFVGGGDSTAAHAVALDAAGDIYVSGSTLAGPTQGAFQALPTGSFCGPGILPYGGNAFVMKMTASATTLAFFATLGGSCQGEADSMALDAAGDIWLAGYNGSPDFPLRAPIGGLGQPSDVVLNGEDTGFVAELNPAGSNLLSATVIGYNAASVAADSTAVYYAGPRGNSVLVAEIDPTQAAPISLDEIVQDSPMLPPAQRLPSSVAPGEIVRILGRGIGPQTQAGYKLTAAGTFPTVLGGVQVTFNGVPAPMVTAQVGQIVCVAPFELQGLSSAVVQVQYNGQTSNAYTVGVIPQNPDALAVVNSDWSANSPSNPAKPGSQVVIFLTGLGQTIPASKDGAINQLPPAPLQTVPTIGFQFASAKVSFIGAAAFEVAGVSQLNLTLPKSAASPFLVYVNNQVLAPVYVAQ